jgi:hypothetical protein
LSWKFSCWQRSSLSCISFSSLLLCWLLIWCDISWYCLDWMAWCILWFDWTTLELLLRRWIYFWIVSSDNHRWFDYIGLDFSCSCTIAVKVAIVP